MKYQKAQADRTYNTHTWPGATADIVMVTGTAQALRKIIMGFE